MWDKSTTSRHGRKPLDNTFLHTPERARLRVDQNVCSHARRTAAVDEKAATSGRFVPISPARAQGLSITRYEVGSGSSGGASSSSASTSGTDASGVSPSSSPAGSSSGGSSPPSGTTSVVTSTLTSVK